MDQLIKKLDTIECLLKKQSLEQKTIFTLEEAAIYLSLSKSSLYKMTSNKEIGFYNPGGKKIYFKKEDIEVWLFSNKVESEEEATYEVEKYLSRTSKTDLL